MFQFMDAGNFHNSIAFAIFHQLCTSKLSNRISELFWGIWENIHNPTWEGGPGSPSPLAKMITVSFPKYQIGLFKLVLCILPPEKGGIIEFRILEIFFEISA